MNIKADRGARLLALMAIVATVAACAVPRPGPTKSEIFAGSVMRQGDAYVVAVNDRVTRATGVTKALGFSDAILGAGLLGGDTVNPGDTLSLIIYENVPEGLLVSPETNRALLEEVQVDGEGYIFVPYAGRIRAAGRSPEQVRAAITAALDQQTPDPQVSLVRGAGDGSTVSVNGRVGAPGVYPIERPTRTLSAMLARAGGVAIQPEIAQVSLTRGGINDRVWLTDIYENPMLDVALRNGDRILVQEDRRNFTVLGATGAQSNVSFDRQTVSTVEALALVGGLNPLSADPTGVFIFRNEPAEIANAVLGRNDLIGDQRFAYVLDLTAPTGMFEARDFAIRDGDTLYVTEAPSVQWSRMIASLTGTIGAASTVDSFGSSD